MKNTNLIILILAGGNSKRLKHKKLKVLLKIKNQTLIDITIKLAKKFSENIFIVINKKLIYLKKNFLKLNFFIQKKALGTGHAVRELFNKNKFKKNNIFLVLYADTPFISKIDIKKMIKKSKTFDVVILGFISKNNKSCGLIQKNEKGEIIRIVEYKNSTTLEKKSKLCNSGAMIIRHNAMNLLSDIKKNKITKEYYLTDIIDLSIKKGFKVGLVETINEIGSRGINDLKTYKQNSIHYQN